MELPAHLTKKAGPVPVCGAGDATYALLAPPDSYLGEFHLSAQRRSAELRRAAPPDRVRAAVEVPEVCQICAREGAMAVNAE